MRGVLRLLVITLVGGLCASPPTAWAQFPGDNGMIAYGEGKIETIPSTGGVGVPLEGSQPGDYDPVYSPDGSQIAFKRGSEIWVIDSDGTDERQVTSGPAWKEHPAWSPDGSMLVYERNEDLWITDLGTLDAHRITRSREVSESRPSWSPDGSTIAYVRDARLQNRDIALMDPDGSNRRRLTKDHPRTQTDPDWSPDGNRIVFTDSGTRDPPSLMSIRPNGRGLRLIFNGKRRGAWEPTYSPDGTQIAFWRFASEGTHIWVIGVDGSGLQRLTVGAGNRFSPSWQPVPLVA
jgi:Tol biopolymer transport system component